MSKEEEKRYKLLLVDDEDDILTLLQYNLNKEGFITETAVNGIEAIEKAHTFLPDLIVLDVMMPEMDGIEACSELRKQAKFDNTMICFLTARGEDYSQIAGYDSGADDYITKPVKPRVLVSKIRAMLRRNQPTIEITQKEVITQGNIAIDREKYLVTVEGKEVNLPKKEFELLSLLVSGQGTVFTRDTILDQVWGSDIVVGDRTIDVHIRKLREKIGENYIKTIKGVGYKFVIND
jgi:two-component system, OmpR family, alkaline phosphatase synthesis response regulator PhoP